MRKSGLFLLIAALIVSSSYFDTLAQAPAKSPAPRTLITSSGPAKTSAATAKIIPAEFVSPEGNFRVLFPGAPKASVSQQNLPTGPAPYHQFVTAKGGIVYLVSYIDYPRAITSARSIKAFFDAARARATADGQKLVGDQEITVDGVTGREFITEDNDSRLISRQFLNGRRHFQLIVGIRRSTTSPSATDTSADRASAFFNSFHRLRPESDSTAYPENSNGDTGSLEPSDTTGLRGSVEGNLYRNDLMSMTMTLPEGWPVLDERQFAFINQRGSRTAGQSGVDDAIDRSIKNTAILVAVSKFAWGTNRNATLVVSTERLGESTITPQAIAAGSLNAMKASLPLRITKEIYATRVGGIDFASFSTAVDLPDGVFRQSYYVANRRGQALTIVFSYVTEDDAKLMEQSLLSIRFAGR